MVKKAIKIELKEKKRLRYTQKRRLDEIKPFKKRTKVYNTILQRVLKISRKSVE